MIPEVQTSQLDPVQPVAQTHVLGTLQDPCVAEQPVEHMGTLHVCGPVSAFVQPVEQMQSLPLTQ